MVKKKALVKKPPAKSKKHRTQLYISNKRGELVPLKEGEKPPVDKPLGPPKLAWVQIDRAVWEHRSGEIGTPKEKVLRVSRLDPTTFYAYKGTHSRRYLGRMTTLELAQALAERGEPKLVVVQGMPEEGAHPLDLPGTLYQFPDDRARARAEASPARTLPPERPSRLVASPPQAVVNAAVERAVARSANSAKLREALSPAPEAVKPAKVPPKAPAPKRVDKDADIFERVAKPGTLKDQLFRMLHDNVGKYLLRTKIATAIWGSSDKLGPMANSLLGVTLALTNEDFEVREKGKTEIGLFPKQ
jgi:hypothetical protein